MSSFENLIPTVMNAAGSATGSLTGGNAQSADAEAQSQAVERSNQLIAAQQAQQERQQRNLLEQQQASARAQMGAWGSGSGGSSDAILEGMALNTAEAIAANDQMAQVKLQRNRDTISRSSSSNLLDSEAMSNGLSIFQSFYGGMG